MTKIILLLLLISYQLSANVTCANLKHSKSDEIKLNKTIHDNLVMSLPFAYEVIKDFIVSLQDLKNEKDIILYINKENLRYISSSYSYGLLFGLRMIGFKSTDTEAKYTYNERYSLLLNEIAKSKNCSETKKMRQIFSKSAQYFLEKSIENKKTLPNQLSSV